MLMVTGLNFYWGWGGCISYWIIVMLVRSQHFFTYKVISEVWMCVIHSIIKNTNNYSSSRDALPPHRHHIEVNTSWAGRLSLI